MIQLYDNHYTVLNEVVVVAATTDVAVVGIQGGPSSIRTLIT